MRDNSLLKYILNLTLNGFTIQCLKNVAQSLALVQSWSYYGKIRAQVIGIDQGDSLSY